MRLESEWPPCSTWDGPEGSFPGATRVGGSFKTLQRTGGMVAGEEASETIFVLAFHNRQPRFANWRLDYRFGSPPEYLALMSFRISSENPCWGLR